MGADSPDNKPKKQSFGGRLLSAFNEVAKDVAPVVGAVKDKVVETARDVANSPVVENVKDTMHEFTSSEEPTRQWVGVLKDTAKDIRDDKKERAAFIAGAIIPGGGFVYGAHRIHKYRKKHGAEGDAPEAGADQAPPADQPPVTPANDTPSNPVPQRKQRAPRPPRQQ